MQEVILQVDWSNEKHKKKAIEIVSSEKDVQSLAVDDENKQLKVNGDMELDPVLLVKKLKKKFPTTAIVYLRTETETETSSDNAPPQAPDNDNQSHPNPYWVPSAPPYGGYGGYYSPQPYPTYGHSYHHNPYDWGSSAPPYGGYDGYYRSQ